jgi:hypothetical protein
LTVCRLVRAQNVRESGTGQSVRAGRKALAGVTVSCRQDYVRLFSPGWVRRGLRGRGLREDDVVTVASAARSHIARIDYELGVLDDHPIIDDPMVGHDNRRVRSLERFGGKRH